MLNLGNKAGTVRISLAVLALLGGSLGVSMTTGLAQKGAPRNEQPPVPATETAKERAQREEDEARFRKPAQISGDTDNRVNRPASGNAAGNPEVNAPKGGNAPQVIQDDGFITITGSTGQLDETNVALADFRNFEVGFRNSPTRVTGSFMARYNVTAVKDAFRTTAMATNNYQLRIRYRDTDGMGANARVQLRFFRASVFNGSGGGEQIAAFDSNMFTSPPAEIFQARTVTFCPTVPNKLDFGNYVYWIEATLTRSDPNLLANFGSLQFTETETPCTPV